MNILNTTGYEMYNPSIVKAENCLLTDSNGKQYYDFESGVWALPLGHNNARVNAALTNQLSLLAHVGYRYSHPVVEEAAKALLEIMDLKDGKCVFLSSGSEAVEFAVRAAQNITGRPYLLNLDNHYMSAYGISGDTRSEVWKSVDWQTYLENEYTKTENTKNEELDYLSSGQINYEPLLKGIPFDKIGAFVFECNTSGTAKLPPKELIASIVSKVKAHGGYIIAEEVTSGMGRTGKWFGYEHYELKPDIIACGKGLGNGYPVSAVGMSEEVASLVAFSNFHHAQSHQNDPLGCAVVREVIETLREEGHIERAARQGEYLHSNLLRLAGLHDSITEVHGIGLMCAIRFCSSYHTILPDLHRRLYEAGFIVGIKPAADVIRFYPPLTIEKQMIDQMISALDSILTNYELETFDYNKSISDEDFVKMILKREL